MNGIGRTLIVMGLVLAGVGVLLTLAGRLPFSIGRLPGDIIWRRGNATVYFPLTTLILINLAIAAVMWLINRR